MEKPFTVTRRVAAELFSLANEKNLYLAEAMWTWFSQVSRQVKAWLDDGEIGQVKQVQISYGAPGFITLFFPRLKDPNRTGGALLDMGVYPITHCYNLFGQPDTVECKGKLKNGVDVGEDVRLSHSNGLKINIPISIEKMMGENLVIIGEKGTIRNNFCHAFGKATLQRKSYAKSVFNGNGGLDNEFDLVAEEIMSGKIESRYVPRKRLWTIYQR